MNSAELGCMLVFLREAERLKNVYRTSWTSGGQRESVASHTWRLCLMALIFARQFEDVDFGKLVKICIVHDLGEAIGGDVPAIHQKPRGVQIRSGTSGFEYACGASARNVETGNRGALG